METSLEKKDILNLANNDFIKSILAPKEEIYLSCTITKYNRYGLKQHRDIIITNMHCLNIYKEKINRKIDIIKIDAVTISNSSKCTELIIHVKNEYDYRYMSPNYHSLIALTIKKVLKMKGHQVQFFMVPQTKLKIYTTTKQEAPKSIFRRPPIEYLVPDNEDPIVIPPIEEKKVEESKQFEPQPVIEDRKQTIKPITQPDHQSLTVEEKSEPVKPQPNLQQRSGSLDSKTFQILSNDIDVIETKPQQISTVAAKQAIAGFNAFYAEGQFKGTDVLISDINQLAGTHMLGGGAIDNFNKNQYAQKVLAVIQNPQNGALIKVVSEKPQLGFELLSCLIADRRDAIEKQIVLDNVDSKKLGIMISNIAKAVVDLEENGFQIQTISPDSILVNELTGQIKVVISKSTVTKIEQVNIFGSGFMQPTFDQIRYLAPEILNGQVQSRQISNVSWSLGIMIYEYAYGVHPFQNPKTKIMQVMIKRYPVVFADLKSASSTLRSTELITQMREGGLKERMPSDFHDLIREMLVKDPSNRLGSEDFIAELTNHKFIKK